MQADGKAWLYAPAGLVDGPLPAHYEPQESPLRNPLYGQQRNPVRQAKAFAHPDNRFQPSDGSAGAQVFPYVATTYRLTEHHTAGGMSRWLPYLAELQPEFFCEVSPELAAERGLVHLGWATIVTARNAVEARVLVTPRIPPLTVAGRRLHQVGLPYHWGWAGLQHRRLGQRPGRDQPGPERAHPGGQGVRLRHPAGTAASRSGASRARPGVPAAGRDHRADGDEAMTAVDVRIGPRPDDQPDGMDSYPGASPRMGFFTDTSVCIGCKACEVACKEWNHVPEDGLALTGMSYDNSVGLGADTWRHVAFIEQQRPADDGDGGLRWLMSSDVCKHCTHAACLDVCPTGALMRTEFGTVVVQADVCNGCGYCIPACPYGVIDQRKEDGRAWKCTLCYDRLGAGMEPACAKACPTDSIQFGPLDELRERAVGSGWSDCTRRARRARGCTGMTRATAWAATGRSSCCSTSPRCTGCRRTRW